MLTLCLTTSEGETSKKAYRGTQREAEYAKRMQQTKVCPDLLRNAVVDKPNQAWSIDITYIPIKRGFLYLTAVIDWHSRCIVGREVDGTLDTGMVISALKNVFQGSQATDSGF